MVAEVPMRPHVIALLLLAPIAPSADRFVSPSGNDAADGSSGAPWRTLQRAADAVAPGDTVHVAAGRYAGFSVTHGGTAAARVAFLGQAGVVITTPTSGAGILIAAKSYVTIDGFGIV